MVLWDGVERRAKSVDRRTTERRRSLRYTADTVIVIEGITWIDNEGTDRRRKIRRQQDRERLAKRILDDALFWSLAPFAFRLANFNCLPSGAV